MFKLITPPTLEPVSLTEIKNHIRLISSLPSEDRTPVVTVQPGEYPIGDITGAWVDVSGYNSYVEVQSISNEDTATLDLIIEESNDQTEIAEFHTFAQITTANDGRFYSQDYTGGKRYIRVIGTVANAAVNVGVNVIKDSPVCSEDTWLNETREVVREEAEEHQGRSFLTTEWELILNDWPKNKNGCYINYIEIEKTPIQSIESIKYIDSDGVEHTFSDTKYYLDTGQFWPRICLNYGESWPSETLRETGAILIAFTAGYTTVEAFKADRANKNTHRWMLVAIKKLYDDRDLDIKDISHKGLDWGRVRGYF